MNYWDSLRNLCPRLYKLNIPFECAHGWFEILYNLSMEIEQILSREAQELKLHEGKENEQVEMFAIQVKEKYGTLRFYMSYETDEIADLIHAAECLSKETCEVCGKHGKMRGSTWFSVRCDSCYEGER